MTDFEQVVVPYDDTFAWVKELFQATGMDEEDAILTADNLVTADVRGVYSHGIIRVPIYIKRLQEKVNNPHGKVEIIRNMGATAVMDGNNAMGQVVGVHAMKLAIEKAKEFGVGYVSVKGSNHYGACAHFTMMALPEDMIGISGTIGSTLILCPWGGKTPLLGNNPFSTAIPALNRDPIVMDMANSVVAKGKVFMAMKTNQPAIPETWALAPDGSPTTDPNQAFLGTLRPVGDHKGYGLTLVTGILSSVLSGGSFGKQIEDLYEEFSTPQNIGHYMQAINISAFIDPLEFKSRVDEIIDMMHNSEKKSGIEEILVPGEMEARTARKQRKEGILYPTALIRDLQDISAKLGVKSRM
jgi:LDH2 family malate/lactate/ureidoglycolate dehydrogenase